MTPAQVKRANELMLHLEMLRAKKKRVEESKCFAFIASPPSGDDPLRVPEGNFVHLEQTMASGEFARDLQQAANKYLDTLIAGTEKSLQEIGVSL